MYEIMPSLMSGLAFQSTSAMASGTSSGWRVSITVSQYSPVFSGAVSAAS